MQQFYSRQSRIGSTPHIIPICEYGKINCKIMLTIKLLGRESAMGISKGEACRPPN